MFDKTAKLYQTFDIVETIHFYDKVKHEMGSIAKWFNQMRQLTSQRSLWWTKRYRCTQCRRKRRGRWCCACPGSSGSCSLGTSQLYSWWNQSHEVYHFSLQMICLCVFNVSTLSWAPAYQGGFSGRRTGWKCR